jgi:hypothetical protein
VGLAPNGDDNQEVPGFSPNKPIVFCGGDETGEGAGFGSTADFKGVPNALAGLAPNGDDNQEVPGLSPNKPTIVCGGDETGEGAGLGSTADFKGAPNAPKVAPEVAAA